MNMQQVSSEAKMLQKYLNISVTLEKTWSVFAVILMHQMHEETGSEISVHRRLTNHFSTLDSAHTLTHGCARCTRGKFM